MGEAGGRHSRRVLLGRVARVGVGAVVAGALGQAGVAPALARSGPPERVRVLLEDVVERVAEFGRGQARGARLGQAGLTATGGEFVSGVVALPLAATHLGLHWVVASPAADALVVAVSVSGDGQAWSAWRPVTIEAVAEQDGEREVFAALVGADRARFARYRLTFPAGGTVTVSQMTVTAIDSVDGPREAVTASATTSASFTAPGASFTVITREGWGCDEKLRFDRRGREVWPEMYVPAKKVVLHHTATSNSYVDGAAEVRAIYAYHAKTQGWGDIGYNTLVDRFGNIYEGRHGRGEGAGREILSPDVVAGHVYAHNYGTTGIAAIGNFEDAAPPQVMLDRVHDVATFECHRHRIDPNGGSDFLRSDDVWHAGLDSCSGHNDSYATACPGKNLKPYLSQMRSTVASRLGSGAPTLTGPATGAGSSALTAPASLTFSFSGANEYCLEGWHKAAGSEPITYLTGYKDASVGGETVKVQAWTSTSATTLEFSGLAAGHYTLHVRGSSRPYEANLTYLVKASTATGGGKRGKGNK